MTALKLREQIPYLLAAARHRLDDALQRALRAEGLALESWRVLCVLAEDQGQSMTTLAETVLVEAATLTKIIDRMVSDTLVYRVPDPQDRRRVLICATSRGLTLQRSLADVSAQQSAEVEARLGHDGAAALRLALEDLLDETQPKLQRMAAR
jgi:DNA-binding MarR family transcriptional regulator